MLGAVHNVKPTVPPEAIRLWGGDPEDMGAARTIEALEAMREYAQSLLLIAADRVEPLDRDRVVVSDWPGLRVVRDVHRRLVHLVLKRAVAIPKLAGILDAMAAGVGGSEAWRGQLAGILARTAELVRGTFVVDEVPVSEKEGVPASPRSCTVTCFLAGGPDRVIRVGGVDIHFEEHPRFGPCPIQARTGKERKLGPHHPFWAAVTAWVAQGRRIEGGRCIWESPPSEFKGIVHIGGRTWTTPDVATRILARLERRPEDVDPEPPPRAA